MTGNSDNSYNTATTLPPPPSLPRHQQKTHDVHAVAVPSTIHHAPSLLTMDSRLSAGWEMTAAATPAMTPDDRDTPILVMSLISLGLAPMA